MNNGILPARCRNVYVKYTETWQSYYLLELITSLVYRALISVYLALTGGPGQYEPHSTGPVCKR